jgi:hypothetical protein
MLGVYDLHVRQPPVLRAHVLCARTPRLPRRAQDGVRLSMPCHLPANVVETASSRTEPSAPRKSCMRFVPCWPQALRSKVASPFSTTLCGCTMSSLCGEQRILDHIDVDPQHPVLISQCSEQQVRLRARSERRSNLYAGPRNSDGHAKPEVAFSKGPRADWPTCVRGMACRRQNCPRLVCCRGARNARRSPRARLDELGFRQYPG